VRDGALALLWLVVLAGGLGASDNVLLPAAVWVLLML